ncbi:transposase [Microcoleus sp. AR_TQ3_B6]|uniref:transposase n=1 Tax=Microcoleus sp. AR_TQ3_B6 TaxID=3055284 RepID=UPI002FD7099A
MNVEPPETLAILESIVYQSNGFAIEEVSRDMWKPYKNVSEALIPQAEVVADRFHVMKQVNEELDGAIKKIKKAAEASKNNSEKARILSGIKKVNMSY